MPDAVSVRVPATSANLGPGFDCLGLALDLWGTITIRRSSEPTADEPMAAMALIGARRVFEVFEHFTAQHRVERIIGKRELVEAAHAKASVLAKVFLRVGDGLRAQVHAGDREVRILLHQKVCDEALAAAGIEHPPGVALLEQLVQALVKGLQVPLVERIATRILLAIGRLMGPA